MEWHPHLTRSLVFQMNLLMSLMCSFVKNVCIWAGAKKSKIWSNHCRYGNQWWQSLYIYTWSWLDLIQIYFCIFLWCCMLGLNWNIHDLIWCVGKDCHWQIKIYGYLHIVVVCGHERGKGYHWDGLVVLCYPSDWIALYDGYLGAIYGFWYHDFVCGNWTVRDLIPLDRLF